MPPQWWANDFGCKDKPQISCFFLYENLTSMFFPGFLLQYQFCRDGSSSPGRRQNIVKPCLPETFAKLADLFMSSSNASLLKPHAWYIKFLDDLNDNLQPFLEPALLPVVARTITASIPPLIVPSLGVRSLFFNTGIIDTSPSVDMKTRLDLNPLIVHPWHSLDSGWTWCFFNASWWSTMEMLARSNDGWCLVKIFWLKSGQNSKAQLWSKWGTDFWSKL